jgi:hypothetical protein
MTSQKTSDIPALVPRGFDRSVHLLHLGLRGRRQLLVRIGLTASELNLKRRFERG